MENHPIDEKSRDQVRPTGACSLVTEEEALDHLPLPPEWARRLALRMRQTSTLSAVQLVPN